MSRRQKNKIKSKSKKSKTKELLGYDAVENWDTPNAGCARPGNGEHRKKKSKRKVKKIRENKMSK